MTELGLLREGAIFTTMLTYQQGTVLGDRGDYGINVKLAGRNRTLHCEVKVLTCQE